MRGIFAPLSSYYCAGPASAGSTSPIAVILMYENGDLYSRRSAASGSNYNCSHMQTRFFFLTLALTGLAFAQAPQGRAAFQSRCTSCHGTDGNGGEHGPSILARVNRTEDELV